MFRSCSQIPPRVRLYLSSKCPEVFYVLCFKRTGINLALPSTECNLTWRRCGIQGDTFLTSWFLWFFTYEWSSAGIHIPEYQLLLFLFCMNLKATTQTHHPYFIYTGTLFAFFSEAEQNWPLSALEWNLCGCESVSLSRCSRLCYTCSEMDNHNIPDNKGSLELTTLS